MKFATSVYYKKLTLSSFPPASSFSIHQDTSIKTASFADLWRSWPQQGRQELAHSLGGSALTFLTKADLTDDSIVRLSVAFNRSGHPIPSQQIYPGEKFAITTKDGFHLIDSLSAHSLFCSKLGNPRNVLTQADIIGRTGILCFERALAPHQQGGHLTHHHHSENASAALHTPPPTPPLSSIQTNDHFVLWNGEVESDVTTDLWKVSPKISFWPIK